MATWSEFEERSPELARTAREHLRHGNGGLNFAFLATQAKSGRLRLHPVCPAITDGSLYVIAEGKTPKKADLRDDGRFALHTLIDPGVKNGQVYFAGRARLANDAETRSRVETAFPEWTFSPLETVFELMVERCLFTIWENGAYRRLKWIEGAG